jgi:hypothetical protein
MRAGNAPGDSPGERFAETTIKTATGGFEDGSDGVDRERNRHASTLSPPSLPVAA